MALKKLSELAEKVILKSIAKSDKEGNNYVLIYKLSKRWKNIVGDEIASMIKIHSISDDVDGSKFLMLKVMNSAYSVEANMYKEIVKQRINTHLGYDIISKVMVIS